MNTTHNTKTRLLRLTAAAVGNGPRKVIRWGETATAVRVLYAVGLIMVSFGGVPVLDFLDTHQTSHLVSGIVIAALGAALLALATVGYRRLPGAERRAIFGNAKQSERDGIGAAAMLAVSGGIQVWLAFTPDVGPKALPIAVLSFGLAALYLVAARRKRRLSSPESHYQRHIRAIQMSTYVRTKPRPAPQLGAHGLEGRYGGGA
jgi:hypothetical protein